MPRAAHTTRSVASTTVDDEGGVATIDRPTTSRVIWQASPEYRLVVANNAFGFSIQALNATGNAWSNIDAMPAYALLPMLRQFGLLSGQIGAGITANGGTNGSGVVRRVRSGTSAAGPKMSTASRA